MDGNGEPGYAALVGFVVSADVAPKACSAQSACCRAVGHAPAEEYETAGRVVTRGVRVALHHASHLSLTAVAMRAATLRATCRGRRKDGGACRSTAVHADGQWVASRRFGTVTPAELGRRSGIRSGEARRELAKTPREFLRHSAQEDAERIRAALREGLEAVTRDGLPDVRARLHAVDAYLNQAFGKLGHNKVDTETDGHAVVRMLRMVAQLGAS